MDFLKDILGEELFENVSSKVNAFNSDNPDKAVKIANLATGLYVDKNKFDSVAAERDGLKTQIGQRDEDIAELKKKSSGNEQISSKLTELQNKYDNDTAALQKQLSETQFNAALDLALEKSGAKSTKALRGLLDMEKITLENNALSGFSEQLEQIKAENDFLFEAEKQKAGGMRQGGSPAGEEDVFLSSARAAAGLKNEKGD